MLETPLTLPCGLVLANRVAKAAMTEGLADAERGPGEELLRLYARWAEGGAGLLVTGNVGVDAAHPVRPRDVIANTAHLEAWRAWARTAKAGGAKVIVQLNHGGRQTPRFINPHPLAPSSGPALTTMHAFGETRAATEAEIHDLVRRFTEAARLAQTAGFDGVQIHAAHGYLLNQFLAPDVNLRQDAWGGDIRGRARLFLEILRSVRAAVGPSFCVAAKINAADFLRGGFSEEDSLALVALLDREGLDLLEISGGRYESAASFGYATPKGEEGVRREAYFASFAAKARALTKTPLLLTGGLRTRGAMERVLEEGIADAVAIARPFALDPLYAKRLLAGEELPPTRAHKVGVAALEGAAELAWYSLQLARMGRGQDPDRTISAWRAFLWSFVEDAWEAWRSRRTRARLATAGGALLSAA